MDEHLLTIWERAEDEGTVESWEKFRAALKLRSDSIILKSSLYTTLTGVADEALKDIGKRR